MNLTQTNLAQRTHFLVRTFLTVLTAAIVIGLVATVRSGPSLATPALASSITYGGHAYAGSLAGTMVADSGPLPAAGGTVKGFAGSLALHTSTYTFNAPYVPGAAGTSQVIGGLLGVPPNPQVQSTASMLNFVLVVGGVTIRADTVAAAATATCNAAPVGVSHTYGLSINGVAVTLPASGGSLTLPNGAGTLYYDQETVSRVGADSSITVLALDVKAANGQEFKLGYAAASVTGCGAGLPPPSTQTPTATPPPCTTCTLSGSASGSSGASGFSSAAIMGCNTTGFGGGTQNGVSGSVAWQLKTLAINTSITCAGTSASSLTQLTELNATIGGIVFHADLLKITATASCNGTSSDSFELNNLRINNVQQPQHTNGSTQVLTLTNGWTVYVEEIVHTGSTITVNGLRIHTTSGQDFILGSVTAATQPAPCATPTPHPVAQVMDRRVA